MIVLAREVEGGEALFGLMDISVRRNAYGRQVESFEADLDVRGIDPRALAGSRITSSWDVHASDGSVTLQLPEAFVADLHLHTGDVHISLDLPVSMEGQLANNNIHGKLNGGGNPLTIHTGDGSIRLQKL